MRIGIYLHPTEDGGGRYFYNLIESLPKTSRRHEYYIYTEDSRVRKLSSSPLVHYRILDNDWASRWRRIQIELPKRLRQDRIDLLHSHFFRFPVDAPCKTVVTIHDALPILKPSGTLPPRARRAVSQEFLLAARLADHIIVPSRHTERQFVERLGVSSQRVSLIYPGCPKNFWPVDRTKAVSFVQKCFRISRPYLLTVGLLIPRKNHLTLIQAFRKHLWKKYDLVIVGKKWWGGDRVLRRIAGDPAIHYLGHVADKDLRNLYAATECLVYPSREEGFGFPPLEAMACGTPVIASRSSAITEVVGSAGLLVEPGSVTQLAKSLEKVADDPRLRSSLRRKGFARTRLFPWEETAKKTLLVYEQVAQSTGDGYQET